MPTLNGDCNIFFEGLRQNGRKTPRYRGMRHQENLNGGGPQGGQRGSWAPPNGGGQQSLGCDTEEGEGEGITPRRHAPPTESTEAVPKGCVCPTESTEASWGSPLRCRPYGGVVRLSPLWRDPASLHLAMGVGGVGVSHLLNPPMSAKVTASFPVARAQSCLVGCFCVAEDGVTLLGVHPQEAEQPST